MTQEINATIRGKQSNVPYEKKTVVLGGNMVGERNILTQDMLLSEDTKYIIRWAFDLDAKTAIMPAGSSLEFNGGSINNGTIVLNDTPVYPSYNMLTSGSHLTIEGNPSVGTYNYTDGMPVWWNGSEWKRGTDLTEKVEQMQEDIENLQINLENFNPSHRAPIVVPVADEEDITVDESPNTYKFKDKAYAPALSSGLGRKYLRKNITQRPKSTLASGSWISYQVGTYLYLLYWYNGTMYNCHKTGDYGLVIGAGQVAEEIANYRVDLLPDYAQENSLEYTIVNNLITITLPDESTIAGSSIHDVTVYEYRENVDDINLLTQEMVSEANTVYIIQYDYILKGNITIPANCVLKFEGGSISGTYTITGQNTGINAGLVKIFNTDVTFAGSWNVAEAYPEWFGAVGDGVIDDTLSFQKTVDLIHLHGGIIKMASVTYFILGANQNKGILPKSNVTIKGTGSSKFLLGSKDANIISNLIPYKAGDYTEIVNFWIEDIIFDSNGSVLGDPSSDEYSFGFYIFYGINVGARRCKFINSYYGAINYQRCRRNVYIEDCYFENIGNYSDAHLGKYSAFGADGVPYDTTSMEGLYVYRNKVINCGRFCRINGSLNTKRYGEQRNIIFKDNYIENCGQGFYTINSGIVRNVTFDNNIFKNIKVRAISILCNTENLEGEKPAYGDNIQIINNKFLYDSTNPPMNNGSVIYLDILNNATISNNIIQHFGASTSCRITPISLLNTKLNASQTYNAQIQIFDNNFFTDEKFANIINSVNNYDLLLNGNVISFVVSFVLIAIEENNNNKVLLTNNIFPKRINSTNFLTNTPADVIIKGNIGTVEALGTTSERPTNKQRGFMFLDVTLNKPIWWTGTVWVDATGASV